LKRSTIILLGEVSVLYFAILTIARGLFPANLNVPIYFLILPFAVIVLALAIDLSGRVTTPIETVRKRRPPRKLGRGIERLTRQVEVGISASKEYYETVLRSRLREILVEKVALESGMDRERTREVLKNKLLGPSALHDGELYLLLYSGTPAPRTDRLADLERTVKLIEAWKP
jgi:hypothetical protein